MENKLLILFLKSKFLKKDLRLELIYLREMGVDGIKLAKLPKSQILFFKSKFLKTDFNLELISKGKGGGGVDGIKLAN